MFDTDICIKRLATVLASCSSPSQSFSLIDKKSFPCAKVYRFIQSASTEAFISNSIFFKTFNGVLKLSRCSGKSQSSVICTSMKIQGGDSAAVLSFWLLLGNGNHWVYPMCNNMYVGSYQPIFWAMPLLMREHPSSTISRLRFSFTFLGHRLYFPKIFHHPFNL